MADPRYPVPPVTSTFIDFQITRFPNFLISKFPNYPIPRFPDRLVWMFRQKTGSVVCASCGSLVGVNDPTCYTCGRRNPGLWGFGPVLRRFGNDFGFTTVIVYGCGVLYTMSLLLTVISGGNLLGGSLFSAVRPERLRDGGARHLGRRAGVPRRPLVDAAQRRLAAWRRAAHPLQRDVGAAAGTRGRRPVRRRPDGDHLHAVVGRRVSSQLVRLPPTRPIPFFSNGHYTLGASAPIFGLLGAMVHYGRRGGSSLVGSTALNYALTMGVFGLIMPGDRQRRAPGRVPRWFPRVQVARPVEARAHGSLHRRRPVPRGDRHLDRGLAVSRLRPTFATSWALDKCANLSSSSPAPAVKSATASSIALPNAAIAASSPSTSRRSTRRSRRKSIARSPGRSPTSRCSSA